MRRRAMTMRVAMAMAVGALLVAAGARADCPNGMVELNCGGLPVCRPAGSSCCGAVACAADLMCLTCEDAQICAAPGSTCCGATACPPDQECTTCGTATKCRRRGEGCPIGDLD
ncbi:hypothetical protein KF840_26110 [bacterium]|nr:hypothetical protein [bacterium]